MARYWNQYRAFFVSSAILLAGCNAPADVPPSALSGTLQNPRIDEASGIARSQRYPDVLWVANDDGPSVLYAIDKTGKDLGRVTIKDASNRDWEDLASFSLDGVPYLLAADIGDNDGKRKDVRIYVIEEPEAGDKKADYAWRIEFSYPEGPRDAEAVAVDTDKRRILVMTKRDVPPLLYALPLEPASKKRLDAERLGTVTSLPQPSQSDLQVASKLDSWHWQPTGMDLSDDNTKLAVLTYGGVFLYTRNDAENWLDAIRRPPVIISDSRNREAESIAFSADAGSVYITLEQRNAPLYRLPVSQESAQ